MNSYLISYDLKQPNYNYEELYNAIRSLGSWWHYLESVWIVNTVQAMNQVQDLLNSKITNTDKLLVIRVSRQSGGWLPKDAWDWINVNVNP